jgi:hypothetical protein
MAGSGVLHAPQPVQHTLKIVLEDRRVTVESNGKTQSVVRGSSAETILHLLNGADAAIPRFAAGVSHE